MSAPNQTMRLLHAVWVPLILIAVLTAFVAVVALTGNVILARTVTDALIRMVMVVGLYIFIGNSGVLAFGHIAFTMIGAYATAWLTLPVFKKSFALHLPAILAERQYPAIPSAIASAGLAALVAFIVGFPIMRLRRNCGEHRHAGGARHVLHLLSELERLDDGRGHAAGYSHLCRLCGQRSPGWLWHSP